MNVRQKIVFDAIYDAVDALNYLTWEEAIELLPDIDALRRTVDSMQANNKNYRGF